MGERLFSPEPNPTAPRSEDPSGLLRIPQVHRRIGRQPGDELCTAKGDTLAIPGWPSPITVTICLVYQTTHAVGGGIGLWQPAPLWTSC